MCLKIRANELINTAIEILARLRLGGVHQITSFHPNYPDTDQFPARNIALMNNLGSEKLQALVQACLDNAGRST